MNRLAIKAAPGGQTIGMASGSALAADGKRTLSIIVLPKLWRTRSAPRILRRRLTERSETLVLHELDACLLEFGPGWSTELATGLLDECASGDSQGGSDALLELGSVRRLERAGAVADPGSMGLADTLLELLMLVDHIRPEESNSARLPSQFLGDSEVLRAYAAQALCAEISKHVRQVRRGYLRVEATTTRIRGRATTESVLRHELTGLPELTCRSDEFSFQTPLLRVIATALEHVVASVSGRGLGTLGRGLAHHAVTQAKDLRLFLRGVRPLSLAEAVRTGFALRFDRSTAPWRRGVSLAVWFLLGRHLARTEAAGDAASFRQWTVSSSRLWEDAVYAITTSQRPDRGGSDSVIRPDREVEGHDRARALGWSFAAPWVGGQGTGVGLPNPDLLLQRKQQAWLLDAKYKQPSGGGRPTRSDEFQSFSFTHLTGLTATGRSVDCAALLYPTHRPGAGFEPQVLGVPLTRGTVFASAVERDAATACRLYRLGLPFPGRADIRSAHAWRTYLGGSSTRLGALLDTLAAGEARSEVRVG